MNGILESFYEDLSKEEIIHVFSAGHCTTTLQNIQCGHYRLFSMNK
jgi:hypothetical protein